MPSDLRDRAVVVLEQVADAWPVIKQPADPGHADQANADLDPARPVDTGQERVAPPPRAQLLGHPARVNVIAAEEPGRGEQREVVQPGDFPYLLDIAGLLLRAMVDPERVPISRRPQAGHGVEEPVRGHHVVAVQAEHVPVAVDEPVGAGEHGSPGFVGNQAGGTRGQHDGEPALLGQSARGWDILVAAYLPSCPRRPQHLVARTPAQFGRGHACRPAEVPAEASQVQGAHTRSGLPLDKLSPTASVARVVASKDSSDIGI